MQISQILIDKIQIFSWPNRFKLPDFFKQTYTWSFEKEFKLFSDFFPLIFAVNLKECEFNLQFQGFFLIISQF